MGNTVLKVCNAYEYLGVTLDSQLTFVKTISKTVSSSSNRCYMMGRFRRKISKPTAILVYKQTILPVLEYCGFIFNGVTKSEHKRLQHVQNRGLRISLSVRLKYHVCDLHRDTGVDYLAVRYDMQLLLLVHKYIYGTGHDPLELGLQFVISRRPTRSTNTGLLKYPSSINLGYRRSPLYRSIELWNSMSVECRLSRNREAFKALAKPRVIALFLARK